MFLFCLCSYSGIVTDRTSSHTGAPMIVHNIGRGPVLEDMLFSEYGIDHGITVYQENNPLNISATTRRINRNW